MIIAKGLEDRELIVHVFQTASTTVFSYPILHLGIANRASMINVDSA